ncbi:MAG TPA: sulfatase [Pirellulales bacterium]|jgi:arylsulfatase|nr:sulfatase [Pirellulales bacterium]
MKSILKIFALVATTSTLAVAADAGAAESRPNVVILFADDLGYGDIGCFGAKGYTTPNLDRMARQGCRFTNFHVAEPVCSASRAALLTGCYPNRIGIYGALGPSARHGIDAHETTLAELLKPLGYATGMAGKWHLGHHPQFLPVHHGFDEYLGLPYSNDMWPHHPEARPKTFPPLPLIKGDRVVDPDVTAEDQPTLTARYTERATSFIDRHHQEPFFFYLAYTMPHVPLFPGEAFRGKSQQGTFGDVVQEIDWSVGQVLEALDRHGLADNTLVIFTSDNGPWLSYGNHAGTSGGLREGKGTCWEGGVREPCVMRWPGHISAGTSNDSMLMTIDVLPTIAGLVGAKLPALPIDGLDVWPLIAGKPGAKNPHEAYFYWYEKNQLQAVVTGDGRWKLQLPHTYRTLAGQSGGRDGKPVKYQQRKITEPELYDLEHDRNETTDVAKQHPEIISRLLALAEQARTELGDSLTHRTGAGQREAGKLPEEKKS